MVPEGRYFLGGAVEPGRPGIYRCLALTAGPARHRVVRYHGRSLGVAPIPLPPLPRGTLPAASAKFHRVLIISARRDHAYASTNNHVISKIYFEITWLLIIFAT